MPQLAGSVGSSLQPEGQLVCPGRQGETHWPFTHTSPMAQAGSQVMGTSGTDHVRLFHVGRCRRWPGRRWPGCRRAARAAPAVPPVALPSRGPAEPPEPPVRIGSGPPVPPPPAGGVRCRDTRSPRRRSPRTSTSATPACLSSWHLLDRDRAVWGPQERKLRARRLSLHPCTWPCARTSARRCRHRSSTSPAAQPIFTQRAVCARVS